MSRKGGHYGKINYHGPSYAPELIKHFRYFIIRPLSQFVFMNFNLRSLHV